jgi:HTH-type transcriptional regulator/antitoxin HigA
METNVRPFRPIKPGELLQEELDARGWTQTDFAEVIGRPVQAVNEIVAGKKAITPDTAVAFSRALGTSAEYWLNLESAYRLDLVRDGGTVGNDIERRARIYSKAPVKELLKRRWIDVPDPNDLDRLEREVCRLLEIDSLDEEPPLARACAARKSRREEPHTAAQVAWAARVKQVASALRVGSYSRAALEEHVARLPRLSVSDELAAEVPQVLGHLGVRFVVVPHLTGTRIDGATMWLDETSPVVAVSLRYDRMDCFFFTLMHELAHVLRGDGTNKVFVDAELVGKDAERTEDKADAERVADRTAGEWLIPSKELEAFVRRLRPYFSRAEILSFAERVGVHPAIVVGRLQHSGEVPWTHFRNLLTKVGHLVTPA